MTSDPGMTVWLDGFVRITGAIGVEVTSSEAIRLVTDPAKFVTVTEYDPESLVWTSERLRILEVAPATLPPFVIA
jgi:hypothetical protein